MSIVSIADGFKTIVDITDAQVAADSSLNFGTQPKRLFFMHGHPKEIVQVLQEYTVSPGFKDAKYPLLALFRDIPETLSRNANGYGTTFRAKFIIAILTKKDYRAADREAQSFKAVLHPLLERFLNNISTSSIFGMPTADQMKIQKWDRYYWGRQEADKNVLNDFIDAVEVDISLTIKNNIC